MKKSAFAEELRRRGFTEIQGIFLNRKMRRKLEKVPHKPGFTQATQPPLLTFATDETRQSWVAKGLVDLSDLGFTNDTGAVYENYQKLFGSEKRGPSQ